MRDRWQGVALVLLAAAVACVPVVRHMPYCGDDLQFHALSWFDAQQSWRMGVGYPHWSMSANFGAGEPRFVFYPPLTWMLGAALGLVMPWTWVPVAMMFLLLAGTGFAARELGRRLLPETAATMAGVAAVLCVYPLFTAYDRAAFGELAGGVCVPLVLLFAMEGAVAPLALAMAACWLSDAPVGVMAGYLLVVVAAANALMARSWTLLMRAAAGGALGLGLAAFYWLPAAYEQRWVNIREAAGEGDPGLNVANNFLFGHSTNPPMTAHDAGLHFVSWLVVWMVCVSVASAVVVLLRLKTSAPSGAKAPESSGPSYVRAEAPTLQSRKLWVVLMCLPVAVLVMQLPVSLPLWQTLPKLRFLQVPWRWLVVLEAPMAVLLAGALWTSHGDRWKMFGLRAGFFGVVIGSLVYVIATGFLSSCNVEEVPPGLTAQLAKGAGSWGADEYATAGSEDLMVPSGLPDVCVVDGPNAVLGEGAGPDQNPYWAASQGSCLATATASARSPNHLRAEFEAARAGWAVVKLRRYPAWRVQVNDVDVTTMPGREDGLVVVPVAPGRNEITADWMTTWDMIASRWVTAIAAVLMGVLGYMERKKKSAEV